MKNNAKRDALALSLLGPWQATLDGESLPKLATVRTQALLAYLAVEYVLGEPSQRRESLIELLWPGMPPTSGRKNLRQTIYYLRQAISAGIADDGRETPLLISDRYKVEINPEFPLWLDLAEFLSILDGKQESWPEAIDLYRGDFLSDLSLKDSNDFEDWILVRRSYLQRRLLDALSTMTDEAIQSREYDRAREYAERQLSIDNLREGAHRQMMELLTLAGRREEALAQYETCSRLLHEQLGMAPSARTTTLYEQIRLGDREYDTPLLQSARGYDLKERIGQGAYGIVHRAIQPNINREVAVKVIHRQFSDDPVFVRRFEVEAQTVARLEHPFIVPLYDYWRDPEGAYLVMRYLRGGNLQTSLEREPWHPDDTLKMLEQVSQALSIAHSQGIVHRDIKPANILLDESGNAYLSDFGIAKVLTADMEISAEGVFIGVPDYISPEQILDEPIGPPSDIYSLGILLYQILTGQRPYPGAHAANLFHKQLNDPLPLVVDKVQDLPPQIDAVIQRATAKRPADRYRDALELLEAFRLALQGREPARSIAVVRPVEIANPYKGLRSFQEADASDFFGRQSLVTQLVSHLAESNFLAVVGPSGSGKSSAVKAGLIPALREGALPGSEKWFVAEMVPGVYPIEELEKALWPVAVDPPPSLVEPMSRDNRGLLRTVRRVLPLEDEAILLLIIDQFEELYTLVEGPNRNQFVDGLLTALAEPNSPLRLVITLRADFYDRPLQHQELGHWLKRNTEVVLPLSPEELTAAIGQPARKVDVALHDGLVPVIVADVQDEPGALPLLQYALTELFDRRQDGLMTLAAYDDIGGVTGALARRAEDLYVSLDKSGQEITHQLFLRLVTLGEGTEDTRRRVLRTELEKLSMVTSEGPEIGNLSVANRHSQLSLILDTFGRYRLLTFDHDPVTRSPTVEVAHEALLRQWPRLRDWLDEGREDIRLQRALANAAAEWRDSGKEAGYLLHGARLNQFENWAANSELSLTSAEQAFLEASLASRVEQEAVEAAQQAREAALEARSRRRLRYLVGVLATATLVAAILVIFAFGQQQTAQQERDNAQEETQARATQQAIAEDEARARATQQAVAEQERAEAERQANLAFSRELAAAALNELERDPELSILLSLEALSTVHSSEAESVLHAAVQKSRVRQTFEDGSQLWGVDYSPDGRFVATGNNDGQVKIWDVGTGQVHLTLEGHVGYVNDVAFNEDGTLLATAGDDNARVWDLATGTELFSISDHSQFVVGIAFSPDDKQLVTSSWDGTAKLWDVMSSLATGSGQEIQTFSGHEDRLWKVSFSPDGKRVATGSSDGTARIWDVTNGEELLTLRVWDDIGEIDGVAFSQDGKNLITGGGFRELADLSVWDTTTGERLYQLVGHNSVIQNLKLSPDGTHFATGGTDGTAKIWDLTGDNRQALLTLAGHDSWVNNVAFSPDGRYLITASRDGTARLWDISMAGSAEVLNVSGHTDGISAMNYNSDGSRLVTAAGLGDRTTARVLDSSSGQTLLALSGLRNEVLDISFSPDGSLLAIAGNEKVPKLWDASSGEELDFLGGRSEDEVGHGGRGIFSLEFSPDGSKLATAGFFDGQAKVWEVATGQEILSLPGHPDGRGVLSVTFSPDGQLLATGSDRWDTIVDVNPEDNHSLTKIWFVETGEELYSIPAGDETVRIVQLSFSPDGSHLAIAFNVGGLEVWQIPQEYESADEQMPQLVFSNPTAHNSEVYSLQFSPDGSQLITTSRDQTTKIWNAATGSPLLELSHPDRVTHAVTSPDWKRLAAGGLDGIVRFITLDFEELKTLAQSRVTRSLTAAECQRYLHMDQCPKGK